MKKIVSVLLTVCMIFSLTLPCIFANQTYTVQTVSDGFVRIVNSDTSIAANTPKTYDITLPKSGNYAVFVKFTSAPAQNLGISASFSQTAAVTGTGALSVSLGDISTASKAYRNLYCRVGTVDYTVSDSVALYAGAATFSFTSSITANVSYIDIRCVDAAVGNELTAIYPSDYKEYNKVSNGYDHINRQISKVNSISSIMKDVTYWNDYTNQSLGEKYYFTRRIVVPKSAPVTYSTYIANEGFYRISFYSKFYSAVVTADSTTVYNALSEDSNNFVWSTTDAVYFDKGYHEIIYTFAGESTLDHITIEPVSADDTIQYLDDDFIRIVNTDTSVKSSKPRTYDITIPRDGYYSVFFKQPSETTNTQAGVAATFTQTSDVTGAGALSATMGSLTDASSAYGNLYSRVGAVKGGTASNSQRLYAGKCTLSFASNTDLTVSYIDIRRTDMELAGGKAAIYPSDYTEYSQVRNDGHINAQISKNNPSVITGYDYWGSYRNENLAETYDQTRQIHIEAGQYATYGLTVTKPGYYFINALSSHYSWGVATTSNHSSDKQGNMSFYIDTSASAFYSYDDSIICQANGGINDFTEDKWHYMDKVYLDEGYHTIKIASSGFGTYIRHLLFDEAAASGGTVQIAGEASVRYMEDARTAYADAAYQDYQTSIIDNYVTSASSFDDRPVPTVLRWNSIENTDSYTLELSLSENFDKDTVMTYTGLATTSYGVENLMSGTKYYWRVKGANGAVSETQSFNTLSSTRWIHAEGARNIRDIGGWNGLKQGMVFRGSELNLVSSHGLQITEEGKKVLCEDLGIKTDLDYRAVGDDCGNITSSPLGSGVNYVQKPIGNYMSIFNQKDEFREVLRLFANPANYPFYMHCWGGADRTGAVAFILEGLCGASEIDLAIDFEQTSFASFGKRYRYNNGSYTYASMIAQIKTYDGVTLQDKFENYAKNHLGLTEGEISMIQLMLDADAVPENAYVVNTETVSVSAVFDAPVSGTAVLALYNGNRFVGIGTKEISNAEYAVITSEYSGDVTRAQVMVLDKMNTLDPQTKPVLYTIE